MVHQVVPHAAPAPQFRRQFDLGADAVDGGDQHRLRGQRAKRKDAAKAPHACKHTGGIGRLDRLLHQPHRLGAGVDVDAGLFVKLTHDIITA